MTTYRSEGRFIGVVPPSAFSTLWYPKRLLLMFDRLALDMGAKGLTAADREVLQSAMPEIGWLADSNMLTMLSALFAKQIATSGDQDAFSKVMQIASGRVNHERFNAYKLRKLGFDAVPICPSVVACVDAKATRDAVIRLVIDEFPAPSDVTPWEAIEDFRRDEDAREKFHRLKRWMNKAAKEGLKEYEVVDELRGLLHDYGKQMQLHRMKSHRGLFEAVLTTTAELAEDFAKLKWSEMAKSVCKFFKEDVTLMADEVNTTGKEVAYIFDANKKFPS